MSDVLLALGNAVLVSGALTLAIFLVQQKFVEQRDRETRLLMTADLSGYDPGPNSADRGALVNNRSECVERPAVVAERVFLRARYLASKRLNGARLGGLNLE